MARISPNLILSYIGENVPAYLDRFDVKLATRTQGPREFKLNDICFLRASHHNCGQLYRAFVVRPMCNRSSVSALESSGPRRTR